MVSLASDWLRHFRLLLWNRWTEFNETWQEARYQRPLPSLCFSGRSEKQDGRPDRWLAETFSTSPLKPLNRIQRNLTGSKISRSSTKFLFFWPIGKTRWLPWPLIGWDIFDFFSETAERNSTKLDRKQDLNVLYQVCVFWPIGKTRWPPWPPIGWDIFDFSSKTAEQNSTKLERKQDLNVLYQVFVFGPIGKTRWFPWPLIGWDIFDFFSETAERNSTKLDRKQDINVLYQVYVFRVDRKNKMAALTADWLRHSRLLLWNHWTEFNETWQEARYQGPLPSFCFFGRSEKQDGCPGLWLVETFSTSSLKPLNGIKRNLTGSKISTSSTKFVFFGPIGKTRWPPWPLIGWDIFDFSSETAEQNSTKLERKQDLNVLYWVFVFGPIGKTRWLPWPLIDWDIFNFFSETAERNSTKLDRKQNINVLYQFCVFRADRKKKMAALASDWLRHFQLILWNRWTEFNETWQEGRSQRPLPSLCFSGRSEKEDGRPGLWLAETFSTYPLKPLNGIQRNWTGGKISTSSTKFVFFGPIGKTRWPPWPLISWAFFDFFSETAERNLNETWQEAKSQYFLLSLCFSAPISKEKFPPRLICQKGGTLYSGARYVVLWASCFFFISAAEPEVQLH